MTSPPFVKSPKLSPRPSHPHRHPNPAPSPIANGSPTSGSLPPSSADLAFPTYPRHSFPTDSVLSSPAPVPIPQYAHPAATPTTTTPPPLVPLYLPTSPPSHLHPSLPLRPLALAFPHSKPPLPMPLPLSISLAILASPHCHPRPRPASMRRPAPACPPFPLHHRPRYQFPAPPSFPHSPTPTRADHAPSSSLPATFSSGTSAPSTIPLLPNLPTLPHTSTFLAHTHPTPRSRKIPTLRA